MYTFCIFASVRDLPTLREWLLSTDIDEIYASFIDPALIDPNDNEENPQEDSALYIRLGAINCQHLYKRIVVNHRHDNDDKLRWDLVAHVLYSSRSLAYEHICSGFNEGKAASWFSSLFKKSISCMYQSWDMYYMFKKHLQLFSQYDGKKLASKITFDSSHPRLSARYQQLCIDSIGLLEANEAQQTAKAWTGSVMVFRWTDIFSPIC